MSEPRLLIAGVGNIFLGDDGFGAEVIKLLVREKWSEEVRIRDFGTRGFDLCQAIVGHRGGLILVDAVQRGKAPGSLTHLDLAGAKPPDSPSVQDPHLIVPEQILDQARQQGARLEWVRLVGCEVESLGEPGLGRMGLSAPVSAAVPIAVRMIREIAESYLSGRSSHA